jgi:cytochrome c biogenesis protein CcmG/thiol:disulfide interchange protein DsbE
MTGWRFFLPLALFLAFVGVAAYQLAQPKDEFVHSAMIGQPMPQFAMRPAVPERPGLALADLRDGKPKLVNIFASWCLPCAAEAPQLAALKAQGAPLVGVAIRDHPEDVAAFLARYGNPFDRIGADDRSSLQLAIGSSGVPETFVVDGKGTIRYQHIGDIRPEQVGMIMDKLREAGS